MKTTLPSSYIQIALGLTTSVALMVIIGWFLQIPELQFLGFEGASMKFNSALCFLLISLALLVQGMNRLSLSRALSFVVALISLSVMLDAFELGFNLNQMLVKLLLGDESLGGMSAGTSFSFLILSIAVLQLSRNRTYLLFVQYGLHVVTFISLLSLISYVYSVESTDYLGFISTMAFHTSGLFLILSICLSLQIDRGLTKLLLGDRPGNILARKMFLLMIGTVILGGYLFVELFGDYHLLNTSSALILTSLSMLILSLIYVGMIALKLNQVDDSRIQAESQLINSHQQLQEKVNEQTRYLKDTLDLLYETNRVAQIGGFVVDIEQDEVSLTTTAKYVLNKPLDHKPGLDDLINYFKPGVDRNTFTKAVNDAISLGFTWNLELKIMNDQGEEKWIRTIGKPTFKGSRCSKIQGVIQDINAQKITEIQSIENRRFLQMIIDNIPVNVYVKDLDSRKTLVNKAELDKMGIQDVNQVLGKSDFDLFPEASAQISRAEDLKVFETGEPMMFQETQLTLASGKTLWYLSSKIPIRDSAGQITGLLGVSVDITNRKEFESINQQMAVAEMRSDELKQIIQMSTGILNALHDLRSQVNPGEKKKDPMLEVDQQVGQITELVEKITEFDVLNITESLQKVDVHGLIKEIQLDLQDLIQADSVEFDLQNLPVMMAYPQKVKKLFRILILFALRGGRVNVSPLIEIIAKKSEQGWLFVFKHNGNALNVEEMTNLSGSKPVETKDLKVIHDQSSLYLIRQIVDIHQGSVRFDEDSTQGFTCYFSLSEMQTRF